MNIELLKQVIDLAAAQAHVWLATADARGRPHVTTAGSLLGAGDGRVILREWFCPATLENAGHDRSVSVVVWPGGEAEGFQLVGRVESTADHAVLDGFDASVEGPSALPQTQRDLTIRVEEILHFRHGPHTDEPV